MTGREYPPYHLAKIINERFFAHRGLVPRAATPDRDTVVQSMEHNGYVRLEADRATPRGGRSHVVAIILAASGTITAASANLLKFLTGFDKPDFDELVLVVDVGFFGKKHLMDVVRDQRRSPHSLDPDGIAAYYTLCPYYNFATDIPNHCSVPRDRVMPPAEVAALLGRERLARADLPKIFTNDPTIVWNGAREGDVVEITRDSQTAGVSIYYRRVERGAY